MVHALEHVSGLADAELVGRLERLVKADRALSAKLLVHLGEVDARKLYCERAYSSMFEYCRSALGMSEAEAALRLQAARVGRRFPLVLERLGAGAVHLSAIKLLAPHLTADNHVQLLDRVRGMSKRHVEVFVADLAPKPDVPARMRRLPEKRSVVGSKAVAASAGPGSAVLMFAEPNAEPRTPASCGAVLMSVESDVTATTPASRDVALMPVEANNTTRLPASCGAAPLPVEHEPKPTVTTAASCGAALLSVESHATATMSASCGSALSSSPAGSSMPLWAAITESAGAQLVAAQGAPSLPVSTFALQSPRVRASAMPLGGGRFGLRVTLGQEAHVALEQLVELLRHQNPSGDYAFVVERALCELLKREMRRRFGQTGATIQQASESALVVAVDPQVAEEVARGDAIAQLATHESGAAKPVEQRVTREHVTAESSVERRKSRQGGTLSSRYVPKGVLREVHARDNGQCTYVSPEGRRCTARGFLEVHHHASTFARGGEATADNLRLTCRAHNFFYAERDYGRGFMLEKLREARSRSCKSQAPVPGADQP